MSNEKSRQKLYIKIDCSVCMGGKRNPGYQSCPYCDTDRKTFIEASPSVIQNYLLLVLSEEQIKELLNLLKDKIDEIIV